MLMTATRRKSLVLDLDLDVGLFFFFFFFFFLSFFFIDVPSACDPPAIARGALLRQLASKERFRSGNDGD